MQIYHNKFELDERLLWLKPASGAMKPYVMFLYEIVYESKADSILEIGVQYGVSTKAMLLALHTSNKGKLTSIDIKNRVPEFDLYKDVTDRWKFVKGDSSLDETFDQVKDEAPFDILFIDGLHTYEGVKRDYELYEPLVKPGGLILIHDVLNRRVEVKDFWPEITYPKSVLPYGEAHLHVVPGMGIINKPEEK